MALPKTTGTKTRTVELTEGSVEVTGLTFGQVRIVGSFEDSAEGELLAISLATGTEKADVAEWVAQAPAGDVKAVLEAISELSGLTEGARFRK